MKRPKRENVPSPNSPQKIILADESRDKCNEVAMTVRASSGKPVSLSYVIHHMIGQANIERVIRALGGEK